MKKQITVLGISVLIITGAAFTAYAQQKDNKNKKEQKQEQGKNDSKPGKQGNGNSGKNKNNSIQGNNNQKGNQGNNNSQGNSVNKGNSNNDKNKGNNDNNNNKGNNNSDKSNNDNNGKDGFSWNENNFKDRKKLKDQEKVTLCHKVNNNEDGVTLRVSSNATKAHISHGDVMGECANNTNNKYSDIFNRKRNDYYNNLQNSYEQVSYSRSILDYAVQRLTNSRLQLTNMQRNNVSQAEYERKQASVAELEQNVSLLETLIGVTANLVVNKLQQ